VKFLVDECAGPTLARWLGRAGYDLRLNDERAPVKIAALQQVLDRYLDRLGCRFVVVTDAGVRIGRRGVFT
jgi:hypothetical protein